MSNKDFSGKVSWITGGGRGIGRAVALTLSARGASVLVTGRNERSIAEVVGEIANAGGKARHLKADVRDAKSARAAVDLAASAFGGLDIVVACAGMSGRVALGRLTEGREESEADLVLAREILETNVLGAYYTFNAAASKMREGGRLIALSSAVGKSAPESVTTAMSHDAVIGLVRGAATELRARNIAANAILVPRSERAPSDERLLEIARIVAFFASDGAAAITGEALSIRGDETAF